MNAHPLVPELAVGVKERLGRVWFVHGQLPHLPKGARITAVLRPRWPEAKNRPRMGRAVGLQ
jgi:hypothetical protein